VGQPTARSGNRRHRSYDERAQTWRGRRRARDLGKLLDRVLAAMEANARDEVRGLWTELDHGLLAHMEAEERFVLPVFAHVDAEEARALLREHGLLREQLLQLGIAVDLHCVRYEWSREFAELLERHAGREENLSYRWADERLAPGTIEHVKQHVGAP
jgi:hypothetical protein